MSESISITEKIFAILKTLILERLNANVFKIISCVPDWLMGFCHQQINPETEVVPRDIFPFLETFLIDAEELWQINGDKILKSGLWYQTDASGKEYHFEAVAICADSRQFILIELKEDVFIEKQSIIQKARENKLEYHYLFKETQKKEVLIHCVIHDIAGQLSGINCCLALLEFENLTPKGKERLEIGKKQSQKQEMLIRQILDAFSAEIKSLESFTSDVANAPNALACVREVIELFTPSFALNEMQLELAINTNITVDWRVIGDKSRLERILTNLIENAFRHSPPVSTVTVSLQHDGEYILFTVDDEGFGVPSENVNSLFQKFSQGNTHRGRIGIGLYFCRITVERWGGTIGYLPRPNGGSCFWFRLPKPTV
ncbi:ATPase [Scytonema hofmannii PCC 7110]|uniref:histidine kinase n=1 Tax=Scytonema hofmannii PCC 7110 TaxID=128403 RepID=A0A139WSB4_9CYAN|nr:HAMP domain-containing sensor histidine kinase [Scytonema hofmannii]KYC35326.1 ATPase [Scytonema hofmannii PCC 7110]